MSNDTEKSNLFRAIFSSGVVVRHNNDGSVILTFIREELSGIDIRGNQTIPSFKNVLESEVIISPTVAKNVNEQLTIHLSQLNGVEKKDEPKGSVHMHG